MGRKDKKVAGGAASGAAAGTAVMPGWGTAIGAVAGGLMGALDNSEPEELKPVVPRDVLDKLYAQASGNTPTVGELKGAAAFDKTIAQQIAAARASRGVNPALLQRNVARIAAEQSQKNAQDSAILSADERNKAMTLYLQSQQLNAGIDAKNLGFRQDADKQANNMMASGMEGLAGSLVNAAKKRDASGESSKGDTSKVNDAMYKNTMATPSAPVASTTGGTSLGYQLPDYSMGADLKVRSDERQKELISSESLPVNNNLNMQNQTAMAPQAQQTMQAPPTQQAQVAQPAQATPQAAVPTSSFGITAEMLQKAQDSSKKGGNVSDIQNQENTLQRGADGPSQDEVLQMGQDAQRRETRNMFGQVTQSDASNYEANLARWYAARDAKNAEFDKQQGVVDEANLAKDAERTSRLNRFYTGIDTGNAGVVASQYATKAPVVDASWGNSQRLGRDFYNSEAGQALLGGMGARYSDEDLKTDKKAEGSKDFNPKSFLDKLQAYSYEYKKGAKDLEGAGEGRHLSVMAQDLEKAGPVGESMVEEDANGNKIVDYGKGFGAILASQAQLNERLSSIEKMYSKKKKD